MPNRKNQEEEEEDQFAPITGTTFPKRLPFGDSIAFATDLKIKAAVANLQESMTSLVDDKILGLEGDLEAAQAGVEEVRNRHLSRFACISLHKGSQLKMWKRWRSTSRHSRL